MREIINIRMDCFGLGDNIAFIPYVEEYRKKTGKTVLVSTFFNELFYKEYPELIFVEPNNTIHNIEKVMIGVSVNGRGHDDEWRRKPLQQVASDILGLEFKEIQPKVSVSDMEIPYENYVCISEYSTREFKEWKRPHGWQKVVDYLDTIGIKTVVCSKEPTRLNNVIDCTGNRPLLNRAKLIQGAKMFIGVSSGLSWLSWAVNTPVIMISGSTMEWHEFSCRRLINKSVCHGCINTRLDTDFNDEFKCTQKYFECSDSISENEVIINIDEILKEKNE
jgi:autotransporter strand-loop-strand O-heptosyltransferase